MGGFRNAWIDKKKDGWTVGEKVGEDEEQNDKYRALFSVHT